MNTDGFVQVARFGSVLEAEAVGHALDAYGIQFLVKSEGVLFGQGAASAAMDGATLWVPAEQADDVARLLACVVRPPDEGAGPGPDEPPTGEER